MTDILMLAELCKTEIAYNEILDIIEKDKQSIYITDDNTNETILHKCAERCNIWKYQLAVKILSKDINLIYIKDKYNNNILYNTTINATTWSLIFVKFIVNLDPTLVNNVNIYNHNILFGAIDSELNQNNIEIMKYVLSINNELVYNISHLYNQTLLQLCAVNCKLHHYNAAVVLILAGFKNFDFIDNEGCTIYDYCTRLYPSDYNNKILLLINKIENSNGIIQNEDIF